MLIAAQPRGGAAWLIDGNNLMHRYFHAAGVEYNAAGQAVHAVRGLTRLIRKIKAQHGPAVIVAVFDGTGPGADDDRRYSGRREIYPLYKILRDPMPTDLAAQIELACAWLPDPRIGCDTVRVEGYEADDVLVTLALSLRGAGHSVYLVTSDKDLHASISDDAPRVAVYNRATGKGAQGWRLYEEADVHARFGVRPQQLLDMLALMGDEADNIPGVPGIGPKTAASLITQYGSLALLGDLISTVKRERLRPLLRAHVEQIRLARRLLEPIPVPLDLIHRSTRYVADPTRQARSSPTSPQSAA